LARLDAQLAAPDLYADAAKASRVSQERGLTAKRLSEAEEAWLEATSAYEDAEQAANA
jgi:ATP-binding cassette subfamily F protein 3